VPGEGEKEEEIGENMPCKPVNVIPMLVQPVPVKLGNDGGNIEKIAVVEVVVVVVAVPKVDPPVIGASFVDDAAPRRLVRGQGRRGGVKPVLE
jgi:hypothetical protein